MHKNVTILDTDFAPGSRVIAISDIHGHADWLRRLLVRADYRPREDYLVIVGDMIEKGPDSLGVVREAMRLAAESDRVHVLMGNVDYWRVESILDPTPASDRQFYRNIEAFTRYWGGTVFTEMCREAGIGYSSLDDFPAARAAVAERFSAELEFIASRPTILRTPRYLFVHGGLPCSEDAVDSLTVRCAHDCLKYDNFLGDLDARQEPRFTRTVLVGHWPTALYRTTVYAVTPDDNAAHNVISLDGGCGLKRDGQLNALLLDADSGKWRHVAVDDLPTVRALDAQPASPDPISINWGDNEVRPTDTPAPAGYVEIEHIRTGRRLFIPDDDIWDEDGVYYCAEMTDYALPVEIGDELRIVKAMPDAAIVKKDGIVGWYRGRYAAE